MVDLVLENGLIFDGKGNPPFLGNISIDNGHISSIGSSGVEAELKYDLRGLVVAPGFIDEHTHGEGYSLNPIDGFVGKIYQGVSTEIIGNCGISVFPVEDQYKKHLIGYFEPFLGNYKLNWNWNGFADLRRKFDGIGLINNVGSLIGHGSIRIAAMGFDNRVPTSKEMKKMESLLEEGFKEGALGLSLGLMYPPGLYAQTEELISLAKIAARYNRPVTSHMRSETFHLLESVDEMILVAKESGCRLVISHHKAVGKSNWGKIKESLEKIDNARINGLDIYIDVYPYTAGNTMLRSVLPPWMLSGGIDQMLDNLKNPNCRKETYDWIYHRTDWENLALAGGWDSIMITSASTNKNFEGKYISDLAQEHGSEPLDFVMDLLINEAGQVTILLFTASELDLLDAMQKPYCLVVSDGIPSAGKNHPRLYGTFPRLIKDFVLDKKVLSMEDAIYRITGLPSEVFGIRDRGNIRIGSKADIVSFDINKIQDNATYQKPSLVASGVELVLINGKTVIKDGQYQGNLDGEYVINVSSGYG